VEIENKKQLAAAVSGSVTARRTPNYFGEIIYSRPKTSIGLAVVGYIVPYNRSHRTGMPEAMVLM
jgi:hypothetical protein